MGRRGEADVAKQHARIDLVAHSPYVKWHKVRSRFCLDFHNTPHARGRRNQVRDARARADCSLHEGRQTGLRSIFPWRIVLWHLPITRRRNLHYTCSKLVIRDQLKINPLRG